MPLSPAPRLALGTSKWLRPHIYSCNGSGRSASSFLKRRILAIETSCDDTAVALLEISPWKLHDQSDRTHEVRLLFNEKTTADNRSFRGIHPLVAHESHQVNLPVLVQKALTTLPSRPEPLEPEPDSDFVVHGNGGEQAIVTIDGVRRCAPHAIAVTRGPGMRSNLTTGLDFAKALAVAWCIPLWGVHHMQAHALTPRLVEALQATEQQRPARLSQSFANLTLLVSGGHTTLLHTSGVADHRILAETVDCAIGDCLDKIGRTVLPSHLQQSRSGSFGPILESFAFPANETEPSNVDYAYHYFKTSPQEYKARRIELAKKYGWSLPALLENTRGGTKRSAMQYTFVGLTSYVQSVVENGWDVERGKLGKIKRKTPMPDDEARYLAQDSMRIAFEHLASRVVLALQHEKLQFPEAIDKWSKKLVISGGVAANKFLRHVIRTYLDATGNEGVEISVPPVELCTDNAAMIAWAAFENMEAGHPSNSFDIRAFRRWSLENILHPDRESDAKCMNDIEIAEVAASAPTSPDVTRPVSTGEDVEEASETMNRIASRTVDSQDRKVNQVSDESHFNRQDRSNPTKSRTRTCASIR